MQLNFILIHWKHESLKQSSKLLHLYPEWLMELVYIQQWKVSNGITHKKHKFIKKEISKIVNSYFKKILVSDLKK